VIASVLSAPAARRNHDIDYAGAGLLTIALTALILATSLGGITFPWSSPGIFGLTIVTLVGGLAFIGAEWRAAEPILPLKLFRNCNFAISSSVGLIVGLSLFGSVTYLPIYLQVVKGETPTASLRTEVTSIPSIIGISCSPKKPPSSGPMMVATPKVAPNNP
jgi:hypothetical protein